MDEDRMDEERDDPGLTEVLRGAYNAPPPTPREEMWAAIEVGLEPRAVGVRSLEEARARKAGLHRPLGWAAAAAVVLLLGVGIGRMSAPRPAGPVMVEAMEPDSEVMRMAAMNHLGRTESLLTVMRADARDGRVDPAMGEWANGLLSQTRLLLDSPGTADPTMRALLEDLELVLMQIVGVSQLDGGDQVRSRSEMNLALEGLEERDVLPRIQAVMPGPGYAGT